MEKKRWYVVNTYSGQEEQVRDKLIMRKESMNMEDYIFRIKIPEAEVVEIKDGVETKKVKKLFPGYFLIEMIMSDEAWLVVRNTPGVTGFIGSYGKKAKPTPVTEEEIERILGKSVDKAPEVISEATPGMKVDVIDGPFSGLNGVIKEILENDVLLITVDLFGSDTDVEIAKNEVSLKD